MAAPYNPAVELHNFSARPGAELVLRGLRDLENSEESHEAMLVLIGASSGPWHA